MNFLHCFCLFQGWFVPLGTTKGNRSSEISAPALASPLEKSWTSVSELTAGTSRKKKRKASGFNRAVSFDAVVVSETRKSKRKFQLVVLGQLILRRHWAPWRSPRHSGQKPVFKKAPPYARERRANSIETTGSEQ